MMGVMQARYGDNTYPQLICWHTPSGSCSYRWWSWTPQTMHTEWLRGFTLTHLSAESTLEQSYKVVVAMVVRGKSWKYRNYEKCRNRVPEHYRDSLNKKYTIRQISDNYLVRFYCLFRFSCYRYKFYYFRF